MGLRSNCKYNNLQEHYKNKIKIKKIIFKDLGNSVTT